MGSRVRTTIQQRKTAIWAAKRQLQGYHEISDVVVYFSDSSLSIAASIIYQFVVGPAERKEDATTVFRLINSISR